MSDKVHVPESQWRKEQRKKRFKDKKKGRKKDNHKNRKGKCQEFDDDFDINIREWQNKWRD